MKMSKKAEMRTAEVLGERDQPPQTVTVDTLENGKVSYPDNINANGGPCIAIGVYDSTTRTGYMIHDPEPATTTYFEEALNEILRDCDVGKSKVMAVGAAISKRDDPEIVDRILRDREYVTDTLRKHFSDVTYRWAPDSHGYDFVLDTGKKEPFSIEFFPEEA